KNRPVRPGHHARCRDQRCRRAGHSAGQIRFVTETCVGTLHANGESLEKGACVMTSAALPAQPVQQFWWIALLQGICAIIVGALLVAEPAETFLALIPLIGIYWLIIGILSLVRIFIDRSVPWILSLLSGIIGVLAGFVVLRHPMMAAILI